MSSVSLQISDYCRSFHSSFPGLNELPWKIISQIEALVLEKIKHLGNEYSVQEGIAIHKDAVIEENVILKGPVIVGPKCFIGAHAYLRGGVFLAERTSVGPGCEIKASIILNGSALAHFNFIGDSILGSDVNLEAGAVIANHYNERIDKRIYVTIDGKRLDTGSQKFGAIVGDGARIGANAVLSPGTVLSS